jgi:Domain of Unknown Function with PDB structure (DUF3857)/Transglutaminase-like superfamily
MQMSSKLSCSPWAFLREIEKWKAAAAFAALALSFLASSLPALAGDAPPWMHALVNAPLPDHDEKTDAVLLYSEEIISVQANGKIKEIDRAAYKILRPDGRHFGKVQIAFTPDAKITNIHGWCIPAQGKDYEVKDKDTTETGYLDVEGGELYSDLRVKVMNIPAAEPGNLIGYEVEQDGRPYVLQNEWFLQEAVPVAETRYTLQLPPGWEYKAVWLNHPEIQAIPVGNNQWQWVAKGLPAIRRELDMPPWKGVAGMMIVSLVPPGGVNHGFLNWAEMGSWYNGLTRGRRDATPAIKEQVDSLTSSAPTALGKMRRLADFLQRQVRYVAISLGIGGIQPHPAAEVFTHRFGDCKDKATLLSSMLKEIGIDSYYVIIHTERGGVTSATPPHIGAFNHAILAIRLPQDVNDPSLRAVYDHPKLGRLLIFDPTDEWTPFGSLRGELQDNYGLLVTDDSGELIRLPLLPADLSGVVRTAKLGLSPSGTLSGDFVEQRKGDSAMRQRAYLKSVPKDTDRIKFLESLLSQSLPTFQITKASLVNLNLADQPFGYQYSLVAQNYAKTAGNLLLVRPRVVGSDSSDLLETKESRKYPVEFEGPWKNSDTIEIAIPAGYEVDDLPPPVDADYGFASYHSKTEASGNTLKYTRTFEVKELSVPINKVEDLKKLYRIIAGDERNNAVLKPVGH